MLKRKISLKMIEPVHFIVDTLERSVLIRLCDTPQAEHFLYAVRQRLQRVTCYDDEIIVRASEERCKLLCREKRSSLANKNNIARK